MDENDLIKKIQELKNLDTKKSSVQDIRDHLEPILANYFTTAPLINSKSRLYRSVCLNNVKPTEFSQIIYPPRNLVKTHQRVNRPDCPVFYCSTSKESAIIEGRYSVGDLITVSEWEVIEDQDLITTIVGYTNFLKKWSSREEVPIFNASESLKNSEEVKRKNEIVKDYLSQLFCRYFDEEHKYKLSIAVSESLGFNSESESELIKTGPKKHQGESPFDAIMFPSILTSGSADNLAVRRYSFHKKIKFVSVDFCRIDKIAGSSVEYEELDFANAINENLSIEWKGRKGNYSLPNNVKCTLKKVAENTWTLSRADGKKLYRN